MSSTKIQRLSPEAIAQIKSSIVINSLCDVISGLVRNALDAGATRIQIDLDFMRGSCEVQDDGHGIDGNEFKDGGGLGLPYCSSKAHVEDSYGRHGTFLAALAGVSLLTISSRTAPTSRSSAIVLHRGIITPRESVANGDVELAAGHSGTRIIVRNLFGNLPVRIKQRTAEGASNHEREWKALGKLMTALLLAWHRSLTLTIKEAGGHRKLIFHDKPRVADHRDTVQPRTFKLQHMLSLLTQSGAIAATAWPAWVPLSASTPIIRIRGAISLDPVPTKDSQYISIAQEPLLNQGGYNELYESINRSFSDSSFGVIYNELDRSEQVRRQADGRFRQDSFTNERLRGARKGIDKWPMFYLRFEWKDEDRESAKRLSILDEGPEGSKLERMIEIATAAVMEWLQQHHFKPRESRRVKPVNNGAKETSLTGMTSASSGTTGSSKNAATAVYAQDRRLTTMADLSAPKVDLESNIARGEMNGASSQIIIPSRAFASWSKIRSSNPNFHPKAKTTQEHKIDTSPRIYARRSLQGMRPASAPLTVQDRLLHSEETRSDHEPSAERRSTAEGKVSSPGGTCSGETATLPNVNTEDDYTDWKDPATGLKYTINTRSGTTHLKHQDASRAKVGGRTTMKDGRLTLRATVDQAKLLGSPVQSKLKLSKWVGEPCLHRRFREHCFRLIRIATKRKLLLYSFRKAALKSAQIIAQVDKKYVLIKIAAEAKTSGSDSENPHSGMLALVDQHAADERIKVERLLSELCHVVKDEELLFRSNLGHRQFQARI